MALLGANCTIEFVRYGMTLRGFRARLYGVASIAVGRQRESATALLLAIGSLFAKGGFSDADAKMTEITRTIRGAMIASIDGAADDEVESRGSAPSRRRDAQPQRSVRPGTRQQRSTADVQRDIRKLDAIMTKITGKLAKNPAGGYAGARDITQFDVEGTDLSDLVRRVE